jgi:hypothetical protein
MEILTMKPVLASIVFSLLEFLSSFDSLFYYRKINAREYLERNF